VPPGHMPAGQLLFVQHLPLQWLPRRRFDRSSSPSAIELVSLPSNSVDRPQNPQQTEAFVAE
jgi:hypothetical protein